MSLALLGAAAGAQMIGSGIQAYANRKAADRAAQAQLRAIQMGIDEQRNIYDDVRGLYDPQMQIGNEALQNLYGGVKSGAYDVPYTDFQYDKTAQDYLDPSMAYQQDQAARQLQESMAAQGGALSGPALAALQKQSQQLAMTDYGNAFNRMQSDRSNLYQQYTQDFANRRLVAQDKFNQLSNMVNLGQSGLSATANARTGTGGNVTTLIGQQGQAQAQQAAAGPAMWGNIASGMGNAAAQGLGSYIGYNQNQNLINTLGGLGQQNPVSQGTMSNFNLINNGMNPSLMGAI